MVEKGDGPPPHTRPADDLLREHQVSLSTVSQTKSLTRYLQVDPSNGLTEERATALLNQNGPNQLKPPEKPSWIKLFLQQIFNPMTLVLLAGTINFCGCSTHLHFLCSGDRLVRHS